MAQLHYSLFFKPDQPVTLHLHLESGPPLEENGIVLAVEDAHLSVELLGKGLPVEIAAGGDTAVTVTSNEGWAIYRCHAVLADRIKGREIRLQLVDEVTIHQRREFYRLDLELPLLYAIPENQQLTHVRAECELANRFSANGFPPEFEPHGNSVKVVGWQSAPELLPVPVNLSGGGIRVKMPFKHPVGTLVLLDLFLVGPPPRVVHTIGSVTRTSELLLNLSRTASYPTSMAFRYLERRDRDAIITHIFNQERENLKKR